MGRYAIHFVNVKNDTGSLACFSACSQRTCNFHHDFHTLYSLRVTPVTLEFGFVPIALDTDRFTTAQTDRVRTPTHGTRTDHH